MLAQGKNHANVQLGTDEAKQITSTLALSKNITLLHPAVCWAAKHLAGRCATGRIKRVVSLI